ncbi:MAG: NUDIX hydrolase [Thermodesulfobacteriota bacterium]|nr:NUDIX hydrolase [Thermodesulfobacteriota bacterium]
MEKKIHTIASLNTHSFSAYLDEVILRNGETGKRIRIDHPEATAVIPFISDDEILMVRQFRYALGRETLEIPAGKVDKGELPEECARRELLEETGYKAGLVRFVYSYAPAIGYSNELIHIYSGSNLKRMNVEIDEREISSLETISLKRIRELIKEGHILDGKTLIGLFIMELVGR